MTSTNVREIAVNILINVIVEGDSLSEALKVISESDNQSLIKEYCYGTCRWYFQCEHFLNQLLSKPLKQKNIDVKILLILGLYELNHMSTPTHAVVNECVKTAMSMNNNWATGLINAILRNFIRKKDELVNDTISHPIWLAQKIKKEWPHHWKNIIDENNAHPPLFLRVNHRLTTPEKYIAETGFDATLVEYYRDALLVNTPCPVKKIPQFTQGYVSVQDCSAQLATEFLQLDKNQRVLDACAAPGGKTCHILERESGLTELVALDINEHRTALIQENLDRLGLTTTLLTADAGNPDAWWDKKPFDRILIDAPCSATGVIRRNPDIKLHRTFNDIKTLTMQQLRLLTKLWPLLQPNGKMLYATCSVLMDENTLVIEQFLKDTTDAVEIKLEHPNGHMQKFGLQFLPQAKGGDGFYYCLLQKITQAK